MSSCICDPFSRILGLCDHRKLLDTTWRNVIQFVCVTSRMVFISWRDLVLTFCSKFLRKKKSTVDRLAAFSLKAELSHGGFSYVERGSVAWHLERGLRRRLVISRTDFSFKQASVGEELKNVNLPSCHLSTTWLYLDNENDNLLLGKFPFHNSQNLGVENYHDVDFLVDEIKLCEIGHPEQTFVVRLPGIWSLND